ncbi:MAG: hypothetical protein EKK42_33295 [Pseudonocardiaceae bacterium]|jgi:hypothetical protein|nr:MAG: hypothetical protein EKK42_33295 [Pseudonocardiaceae bacterium]
MSNFLTELTPTLAVMIFLGIPLLACGVITGVVVWRVRRDYQVRGVPLPRDEDKVTEPILGPATEGGDR